MKRVKGERSHEMMELRMKQGEAAEGREEGKHIKGKVGELHEEKERG